jgi:type II secretory pathway pseudopilin PulG
LLEIMVSGLILGVVTAAVLTLLYQGQETFQTESRISRSSTQVRLAMDQIVRSVRHAGNDPLRHLADNDVPPIEILSSEQFRINSDLTGSVASVTGDAKEATGDPDGALDSIFEQTTYRYDADAGILYVDVGYGETVLVDGLVRFSLTFFDELGSETADEEQIARVQVWLVGTATTPSGLTRVIPLSSEVFIRTKALALGG